MELSNLSFNSISLESGVYGARDLLPGFEMVESGGDLEGLLLENMFGASGGFELFLTFSEDGQDGTRENLEKRKIPVACIVSQQVIYDPSTRFMNTFETRRDYRNRGVMTATLTAFNEANKAGGYKWSYCNISPLDIFARKALEKAGYRIAGDLSKEARAALQWMQQNGYEINECDSPIIAIKEL